MVAFVGDIDAALRIHRHTLREFELPGLRTEFAPLGEEASFGVELLHAVIERLDDIDMSFWIDRHIARLIELFVAIADAAPESDELAVGSKLLDAVIA